MTALSSRSLWTFVIGVGTVSACSHGGASPTPEPRPEQPSGQKASVVNAQAIENSPGVSVERILADRVPGVRIGKSVDGSMTVQIRGATSFTLDNQPLYIIDGIPITPGPGGSLSGISPSDI